MPDPWDDNKITAISAPKLLMIVLLSAGISAWIELIDPSLDSSITSDSSLKALNIVKGSLAPRCQLGSIAHTVLQMGSMWG